MTDRPRSDAAKITANVPDELRAVPQWVAWKYITRKNKLTKCPINPHTGKMASSTDPATWATFEKAMTAFQGNRTLAGVGFVFAESDPYCGIDLDNCLDEDGRPKEWAEPIIKNFGSYIETSPSGHGVKIFIRASKPGDRCRTSYGDGEIELYDGKRFFTCTGNAFESSVGIEDKQSQLDELYRDIFEDPTKSLITESTIPVPPTRPQAPTAELVAVTASNGSLVLSASGEPPAGKLDALIENDQRFALTWGRRRTDLKDQSPSGYEMSLANIAVATEWSDQEIANLMIAWRRRHGEDVNKALRQDHVTRTIAKAREGVELRRQAARNPIAVLNVILRDDFAYKGPEVVKVLRLGESPKERYNLCLEGGPIVKIPNGKVLFDVRQFNPYFTGAQAGLPNADTVKVKDRREKANRKAPKWDKAALAIIRACEIVETDTAKQAMLAYLESFTDDYCTAVPSADSPEFTEALAGGLPMHDSDGRLYVSLESLVTHICVQCHGQASRETVTEALRNFGFNPHKFCRRPEKGKPVQARLWVSTPNVYRGKKCMHDVLFSAGIVESGNQPIQVLPQSGVSDSTPPPVIPQSQAKSESPSRD